jgi:hypothetical protein
LRRTVASVIRVLLSGARAHLTRATAEKLQ